METIPEWFDEWFEAKFRKRWYGALELSNLMRVDVCTIYRNAADQAFSDESDKPLKIPREMVKDWLIKAFT
jgi:hypothetical protein